MRIRRGPWAWLLLVATATGVSYLSAQTEAPYAPSPVIQGANFDHRVLPNWGDYGARESLGINFPTKWINVNGTPLWGVFSDGRLGQNDHLLDSFNLVKWTLLLRSKVKKILII